MARDLYLHEVVDIVGEGAMDYMAHVVGFDAEGAADRSLALVGTWYVMGSTGRWPQVVNLWDVVDGWDGWRRLMESTNLARTRNAPLNEWWRTALEHRSGGFERLLAAAPGSPTPATLAEHGVTGSVFVHELTTVPSGGAGEYLAAVQSQWQPIAEELGHTLVGAYEVLMTDTEVCTIWATTLEGHVARMATADIDPRLAEWDARRRGLCTHWREELITPAPGSPLSAGDTL